MDSPYTTPGKQRNINKNCISLYSKKAQILDQHYLEAEHQTKVAKIYLKMAELEYKIHCDSKLPEAALNYEAARKRARYFGVDPNMIDMTTLVTTMD